MSKTYQITITEEQLKLIARSVELVHRAVCGQFMPLFDEVDEKNKSLKSKGKIETNFTYDEKVALEKMCQKLMITSATRQWSGSFDLLGYQTYRDILEYYNRGTGNVYDHVMDHEIGTPKMIIKEITKL